MKRREFLKLAGAASAASAARGAKPAAGKGVTIVVDVAHIPGLRQLGVQWGVEQLRNAIVSKGLPCRIAEAPDQIPGSAFCVTFTWAGAGTSPQNPGLPNYGMAFDEFRIVPGASHYVPGLLIAASNGRGFAYALLELAERVRYGLNPLATLHSVEKVTEKPANEVRTVGRYFCSELEDKPWLYDRSFWPGYLDVLAASRFNRFCLAFGLEYDFPKGVTSDYLHFPYPYLVEVPGYDVRVMQLAAADGTVLAAPMEVSADERQRNFDALRFIASETAKRGLHFQLGIWTHAYKWTDSPNAYHRVEGLTPKTHAAYCRDALTIVLKEVPEIQGLTMRVHGESGIPEGSYDFWNTLFEAVKGCGRTVEIDMHAKGVDQKMIDIAVATGMPVKLGAKYSAEHQSLGYQQADIRALEIPKGEHLEEGPFALSSGARSFTRYGYADFLAERTKYKVLFRLWPGTQRHLLSADPEMAAAYGRTAHFCGAAGLDLMEPLTFKGREGSGHPGGRCAYADASLNPAHDWEKFELYYRVWGRKLYDPEADPETWRSWMRQGLGPAALPMETAVASASRVLPLLTSAHLPSASNHSFWAELYTNMPIVQSEPSPYSDTPEPKCFATVSPLDPQLFSTIEECAEDLLAENVNAKYSPLEVAQWMEDLAIAANTALSEARAKTSRARSAAFRRMEEDVLIQAGLGQFFAAKIRSGVLAAIFEQTGDPQAGALAVDQYRLAREAWATMANRASAVYLPEISYGSIAMRRGHWSDRLAAIDKDIGALVARVRNTARSDASVDSTRRAIQAVADRPVRSAVDCAHAAPAGFRPGAPLALSLAVAQAAMEAEVSTVYLHYRHVNQAERWKQMEMQHDDTTFASAIPADYTESPYAMAYYFEFRGQSGRAWLYPALNATFSNQPYFAIEQRRA